MAAVRSVLVTSASPRADGPLGERARWWQAVLGRLGPVHTVLVPVAGQPKDGDHVVSPLPPSPSGPLPKRARQAPTHLGRAARADLDSTPHLVVAIGADVGLVAVGLGAGTGAVIAVDLGAEADPVAGEDDLAGHRILADRLAERVHLLVGDRRDGPWSLDGEDDIDATAERVRGWFATPPPAPRYRQPDGLVVTEESDGLVVADEVELVTHHLNELSAAVFLLVERPMTLAEVAAELAAAAGSTVDEVTPRAASAVQELTAAGLLLDGPGARRA